MIKETVLIVCIIGMCSCGITYNNVVKPENKPNVIDSSSDDLEGAESAQFFGGGFVPNGYGAYGGYGNGGYGGYGGYGGGYDGGYGGYGGYGNGGYGGYGGYGGDYGGFGGGGCCGGFGYGKK